MRSIAIIFFVTILSASSLATTQIPDIIHYQNQRCELHVHWSFPSPLRVYFIEQKKKNPFRMISTANYRGHIAEWRVSQSRLYLVGATVDDNVFDLKKIFGEKVVDGKVEATWFSGTALVFIGKNREAKKSGRFVTRYTHYAILSIVRGLIVKEIVFTADEYFEARRNFNNNIASEVVIESDPIFEYERYKAIWEERIESSIREKKESGSEAGDKQSSSTSVKGISALTVITVSVGISIALIIILLLRSNRIRRKSPEL